MITEHRACLCEPLADLTDVVSVAVRDTLDHTTINFVFEDGSEEEVIRVRFADEALIFPLLRQVEGQGIPITQ